MFGKQILYLLFLETVWTICHMEENLGLDKLGDWLSSWEFWSDVFKTIMDMCVMYKCKKHQKLAKWEDMRPR
jgi:hypothetical protein